MDYKYKEITDYHYDLFPPAVLNYEILINHLIDATDALARFDAILKTDLIRISFMLF
ncbi:hypothetical protein [Thorsellia anophelis]|uniref:Uncharacterized protein n=1 Tax=Thorsellia anophelis DSM 18579 TaxID=1123402 RepID=A0A1H9YU53_9GAMM|nr:hypothetical protein [Thorsellia anophelis]SES72090.1 hypothetical protein SAMN02583745_00330 [Thorsellia anophelis DSM 18579]